MKSTIISTLLILFCSTLFSQGLAELDEKNGFRDAVLGTTIDLFENLTITANEGDFIFYKRQSDELKLGNFDLESITYAFYKNQLADIVIISRGANNSMGVLSILQTAYGKGKQNNQFIEEYHWMGQKVFLVYNENSITNNAEISFTSIDVFKQIEEDFQNAAKDATRGL